MATAGPSSGQTLAPWNDLSFVDELLETLELDNNNIEAKKLLIDQYRNLGWGDAAADLAEEILVLQPGDQDALAVLTACGRTPGSTSTAPSATVNAVPPPPPYTANAAVDLSVGPQDVRELKEQYLTLRKEADTMLQELEVFQRMTDVDMRDQVAILTAIGQGLMHSVARGTVDKDILTASTSKTPASGSVDRMTPIVERGDSSAVDTKGLFGESLMSSVLPEWISGGASSAKAKGKKPVKTPKTGMSKVATAGPSKPRKIGPINGMPRSAKALATAIKQDQEKALEIAFKDTETLIRWQRSNTHPPPDDDAVRTIVRRRIAAVESALPKEMAHIPSDAFMHIQHEVFKKTYANTETMLGDAIVDVSRHEFWVSEDNFAWSMSELVSAIKASNGSLRNPLTKEPLSAADIEAIVRHPLGKEVAAVQIEQSQLRNGVRPETVNRLKSMSEILLGDDSENSFPSHQATDEFLSYMATLPADEQAAIAKLKVPAVDSHSGEYPSPASLTAWRVLIWN
jgi:hypothetical protein